MEFIIPFNNKIDGVARILEFSPSLEFLFWHFK